ncbi:MAG: Fur family transcriptional regulator [Frankiaceae bacterium]
MTKQQRAVAAALDAVDGFRSAQELHADLRAAGDRVGLTTVYRVLQAMAERGEVDVIRNDNAEARYRRCGTRHHHHLVCRSCGRAVEVTGAAIERWASDVARRHGFREVQHMVEVVGTCERCA